MTLHYKELRIERAMKSAFAKKGGNPVRIRIANAFAISLWALPPLPLPQHMGIRSPLSQTRTTPSPSPNPFPRRRTLLGSLAHLSALPLETPHTLLLPLCPHGDSYVR
eukprot:TRINITY_DN107_c0_g1_i2.p1 TRINITY_DN107_c0_g1~~TRINITY_DN107_c0_g1_i2.p1  ORF type:complete len:108 (+),score=1.30 TRINITY_DN107_c0_g1_i2:361-684(+)